MFAHGKLPVISTLGDIKVSKLMIDLWTSFAKNGYFLEMINKMVRKVQ